MTLPMHPSHCSPRSQRRPLSYRMLLVLSLLAAALLGSARVSAHGGEDHTHDDAAQSPAATQTLAPRAWAQSEDFELVAVLEEGPGPRRRLLITLDHFTTNEPVRGARLEVDAGGDALSAPEGPPGVYALSFPALDALAAGSRLPLTISVEARDRSDLLSLQLALPALAPTGRPSDGDTDNGHGSSLGVGRGIPAAVWAGGAALVMTTLALTLVLHRRSRNRSRTRETR